MKLSFLSSYYILKFNSGLLPKASPGGPQLLTVFMQFWGAAGPRTQSLSLNEGLTCSETLSSLPGSPSLIVSHEGLIKSFLKLK